ncbi:DUF1707 SHOCT-like domain-containing protein [Mariniluteicoccus flavus]
MSNLPISSKYRSRPNDPVPEAERNDLSTQLNQAFTDGKVDQDQYDQLLNQVFDAQNLGELAPVVEALGKPMSHNTPAIVAQASGGRPGELAEGRKPSNRQTMVVVGALGGLAFIIALILGLLIAF